MAGTIKLDGAQFLEKVNNEFKITNSELKLKSSGNTVVDSSGNAVLSESGGTVTLGNASVASTLDTTNLALSANNAGVKTALNASGDAPVYACRAWVNFNGTGTVAIRASGNVSSVTDNGDGIYTVNFTTAMSDADYSAICSCVTVNGRVAVLRLPQTTSTVPVGQIDPNNGVYLDTSVFVVAIFH